LLVFTPRFLSAAEKTPGGENAPVLQVRIPEEPSPVEQNRTPGEQHPAESPSLLPVRSETIQTEISQETTAIAPYISNPMAAKAVDRNISLFAERIRERFSLWLLRSGKYLDLMKEILKGKNIPEDIAFLPLIESGFNPNAYSVARAVGPWQFIASTARRYGLKIDWWRDERKDPVKSTEAAANYLKDLYEMFGSWNLAMAAYNAGEGKILKALNRSKSDDYWALLNTRYIKNETKEYVPRFIAAKLIATDPYTYGFADQQYHPALTYDEVIIDKPIDLDVAAACAETSLEMVRELNPELRRWSTPPNVSAYTLRIPFGKKDKFAENLSRVAEEERFSIAAYTVKKGDTVKKISSKTGIPVSAILELNDERGMKSLKAGEKIYLPPKEKFSLDRDDKVETKKVTLKTKRAKGKKPAAKKIIASLNKKQTYLND
jgi:membrane-bound lytic murein transglycosylase D